MGDDWRSRLRAAVWSADKMLKWAGKQAVSTTFRDTCCSSDKTGWTGSKCFRWSSQFKRRNRDYKYLLIFDSYLIEGISYYCYDVKWNEKTILCLLRDSTSSWQVRVQIAYLSRSTPFFFECFVFRFRRSSSTHSNDDVTSLRRASRWRIRSIHEPLPTSEVCPGWSLP